MRRDSYELGVMSDELANAKKRSRGFVLRSKLRTIFLTLFTLHSSLFTLSAQHYIGVKGGYGAAQGRLYTVWGTAQGELMWNKYTAGVGWKYFSPQQVVGGLSAELEYQMRGYRAFDGGSPGNIRNLVVSDTTSYRAKTRTVSSITLPLIWQPHLYMFNRKVRFFVSAGITFSYNTGIGDTYTVASYLWDPIERVQNVSTTTEPYEMQRSRDVRWHYGWLGGAGIGVSMGRWEVVAEGRYYYGMADIIRNDTKYHFNPERTLRSELDNIYITVGVWFRLGKGGILAPPLRRRTPIPVGDSDFRNIKLNM